MIKIPWSLQSMSRLQVAYKSPTSLYKVRVACKSPPSRLQVAYKSQIPRFHGQDTQQLVSLWSSSPSRHNTHRTQRLQPPQQPSLSLQRVQPLHREHPPLQRTLIDCSLLLSSTLIDNDLSLLAHERCFPCQDSFSSMRRLFSRNSSSISLVLPPSSSSAPGIGIVLVPAAAEDHLTSTLGSGWTPIGLSESLSVS